jgi:adenine-specific DNA-methyltransferase
VIKYLGSKRLLTTTITAAFADLDQGSDVLDLFSGTSRVSQALKKIGMAVTANDHNNYAHTIARCYVEADRQTWEPQVSELVADLESVEPKPGWFTRTYCEDSRFFHPDNGGYIDAMRNRIDELQLAEPLRSIMLVSLMEAADRVDSTTGVQMAYLKKWAARATRPISLRVPQMLDGHGQAWCSDAVEAAGQFKGKAAYLDPPYNQHSYRSNYHIWETLVRWDEPEVYGIACKRIDCRTEKSDFNSRRRIVEAFSDVIDALDVERIVVSFNNEGYLPREQIEGILSRKGSVHTAEFDFKRYIGATIGVHNLKGEKVGTVSHTRNKELLFVVDADPDKGAKAAKAALQ